MLTLSTSALNSTTLENICQTVKSPWALVPSSRSRLGLPNNKVTMGARFRLPVTAIEVLVGGVRWRTRSSDILMGLFWELVIIQQRQFLAVITAKSAMSAFICTIATMQGAALGTWYTVMDNTRTRAALRAPLRLTSWTQRGCVRRWTSMARGLH